MKGEDFPEQFIQILLDAPELERAEMAGWIMSTIRPTFGNLYAFWKACGTNVQMVLEARAATHDFDRAANVEEILLKEELQKAQGRQTPDPSPKEEEEET